MAGKLSITAFAGPQAGFKVPIYVSATNDLGIGMAEFTKGHFKLEILHPLLNDEEQKRFKLKVNKVENLGNGLYKVVCGNSEDSQLFLSGRIILSLRIVKPTGGFGLDSGQTLVSFEA